MNTKVSIVEHIQKLVSHFLQSGFVQSLPITGAMTDKKELETLKIGKILSDQIYVPFWTMRRGKH